MKAGFHGRKMSLQECGRWTGGPVSCVAGRPLVSPCDPQVLTALQKDSREMEKGSPSLRH